MNFQTFKSNVTNGPITKGDIGTAVAGLFLGGPLGALLSPVAYRGFQRRLASWAVTGAVAFVPLVGVTGVMLGGVSETASSSARPTQVASAPARNSAQAPRATFNRTNWNRLRTGMTKTQVESIIGSGKLLSSMNMMGSKTDMVQYGSYFSNYGQITYSDGVVFALTSNFG